MRLTAPAFVFALACLLSGPLLLCAQEAPVRADSARGTDSARGPDSTRTLQRYQGRPRLLLGLATSITGYQGDLTTIRGFHTPGIGAHFTLQFNDQLADELRRGQRRVRLQLAGGFGAFQADDRTLPAVGGRQGNRFVSTRFWYVGLNVIYRPMRWPVTFGPFDLRPHVSGGLGLLNFTPRDAAGTPLAEQPTSRALGETYATGTLMVPIGLGTTLQRQHSWGLSFDYHFVFTGSSYLDNLGQLGRGTGADRLHRFTLGLLIPL